MSEAEKCVCCGATIPEGRQVCIICGYKVNKPDLVEVVRCKDCKHFIASKPSNCKYHTDNAGYCDEACWVTENDFCSYGELKECEGK